MNSKQKPRYVKFFNNSQQNVRKTIYNWSDKQTSFINYEKQVRVPFIVYAHFEALRTPCKKPRSNLVLVHKPCGFGYSIKCSYDASLSKYEEFYGENCAEVFWEKLEKDATDIAEKLKIKTTPQILNDEEKHWFDKITRCYFCRQEFDKENYKCEDYDELTGQFVGAIHKQCKQKSKIPNFIPVVMHNLTKYGAHFVLSVLNANVTEEMFFITESGDSHISFSRKLNNVQLRFIDSNRFLDSKIEDLEEILDDAQKHRLKTVFKKTDQFQVMKKKGSFPHHHVDSFEKFSEKTLPGGEGFYDQLHDAEISDEDYHRSKTMWKIFNCKTLGDYFSLYVQSNVLLLEDIFENFRALCLNKYGLDPAHYFTVAALGWDAMLKYTKVQLELLQDRDMIHFIKSNIRGGITQCSKRLVKANNKYCTNDNKSPSTFIVYLDANNLAGFAMSQYLPFSEFSWLSASEIDDIKKRIITLKDDDDYGYILEVDLDYPKKLHKAHNDLPFCCQRIPVLPSSESACVRSTLTLFNKKKYVIDYRNLRQCLENELELKKIHRVLKFKQCKWLEPYIAYNTQLRSEAKNDFEVKLYKLLNNSVYGKTIQKTSTDKPIYAGFCILELSKKLMYDFHYNQMIPRYNDNINLLYMDTDAFIYEIKTKDFYRDLRDDRQLLELFDTSDMDRRWNIPPNNKKVVGKMKDECNGKIIREFYGVGAKVYCLDVEGEQIKKAVGVSKYVKQKHITKHDYENCVMNDEQIRRTVLTTVSKNHELQTTKTSKICLSPGDNKRLVLANKIDTLAWGYQE